MHSGAADSKLGAAFIGDPGSREKSAESDGPQLVAKDALAEYMPLASWLLFIFYGWSIGMRPGLRSSCATIWRRLSIPLMAALMIPYFFVQMAKPLHNWQTIMFAYLVAPALVFTAYSALSSLAALSRFLALIYQDAGGGPFRAYRSQLKAIQVYVILVGVPIFELTAFFVVIVSLTSDLRKGNSFMVLESSLWFLATPVMGILFLTIMLAFNVMCLLHEVQLDVLVSNWRRRTVSPLLLVEPPPASSILATVTLNFFAGTEQDPTGCAYEPFVARLHSSSTSMSADEMPLSAIVLQYMTVRRSFAYSSSCWSFPIALILYTSCGYTIFFGYRALMYGDFSGVPFTCLQPITNYLLLAPLARINSKWASLSTAQLDFSVSRYNIHEQILLGQLQTKQPLQFCIFGVPLTWMVLVLLEHAFILLPVVLLSYLGQA